MIVPRHWAEAKIRHKESGRQMTVRRFGWSDIDVAAAQTHAEERCRDAMARLLAGEKLQRLEPKVPYNGADGVPIREEIIEARGDAVITRNSYGALCLNTPGVFFADVDLKQKTFPLAASVVIWLIILTGVALLWTDFTWPARAMVFGGLILRHTALFLHRRFVTRSKEGLETQALGKIRDFTSHHPEWNFRIYRTPAGLRALASHRLFVPRSPEVAECFEALGTDPVYRAMCIRQNCFRARVSPKPWRIGIGHHMRPRPGTWPVHPDRMPLRNEWIRNYEQAAAAFAACSFLESIGSGTVDYAVEPVMKWHDDSSGAFSGRPIA